MHYPSASHPRTRLGLSLRLKQLALPIAAAVIAVVATNALASTLQVIPLYYNGSYGEWQNEGRAITLDGAFVAVMEYQSNTVWGA